MSDNRATARDGLSPEGGQQTAAQSDFIDFFRAGYRKVTAAVMAVGATPEEADEATQSAMETVLRRWDQIDAPLAYAKKAALHSFYKEKERGLDRIRRLLAQGAEAQREGADDAGLNVWEDRQWVTQILDSLPPAQREVVALVVDEFTPAEIARLLGKTTDAVRQNLHAARTRLTLALLDQHQATQQPASRPKSKQTEGGP